MKDYQHIFRVAAAFVLAIAGFLVIRHFVVPASFGKIGHYRADAVDEIQSQSLRYAGDASCGRCHSEQARAKASAGHRGIRCESCHGALLAHVENPKALKPGKAGENEMRGFCGWCHEKSLSRPAKFPQVSLKEHNPDIACNQCHPPHQPR